MNYGKLVLILFAFLFFSFFSITNAASESAGFVDSSIWYSKDSFVEGEKIKIYTFIFNPSTNILKGTVSFFDNATLLGKKDFSIAGTEGKAISIDWNATVGAHKIFARIEDPKLQTAAGKYEEVDLNNTETEKSNKVVPKKLPDVGNIKSKINEAIDSSTEPLLDVGNNIAQKTPEYISSPITKAINAVESVRIAASNQVEIQKAELQSLLEETKSAEPDPVEKNSTIDKEHEEIQRLEDIQNKKKERVVSNIESIKRPLKYVELFFLTALGFVLGQPILLYIILAVSVIILIRFVYRTVF